MHPYGGAFPREVHQCGVNAKQPLATVGKNTNTGKANSNGANATTASGLMGSVIRTTLQSTRSHCLGGSTSSYSHL
jgi:hypothetical protein